MTTNATDDDRQQITALFGRLYQAWRDNDADAFAALYRDDATVTMPGVLHRNREEVRASMAARFAGPLKGSQGVDEPVDIRVLGDVALVVSEGGILMAGATTVPEERKVYANWVLHRLGGEWTIASYANTPKHRAA